jgi:uncharacterized membrane protein
MACGCQPIAPVPALQSLYFAADGSGRPERAVAARARFARGWQFRARMEPPARTDLCGMMTLVFVGLAIAALWINLLGAGLAAQRLVQDYAVARVTGVLAVCLACFFLEHFAGWGPHPPLLPFTTAISVWLIWRCRRVLAEHPKSEILFATGFLYCLVWRFTFPNIDDTGEKMPNLMMIEAYMRGTRLPPPDLWLSPFRANCYYSFQHYGAGLLGRLLGVGPGVSYHLAYCTLAGLITLLVGATIARLCAWPPGRWTAVLALLVGGSGTAIAVHLLLSRSFPVDAVRFLGGSIVHQFANPFGQLVASWMDKPDIFPRDLPMEPLSYVLTNGDYHPPLAGFLLLALATTLIAAQATGAEGPQRAVNHAILAATVPIALISNAWIFPLQFLLVWGWFVYRIMCRESRCWLAGLAGAAIALALEYPYLLQFSQQAIGSNAAIQLTTAEDHTPWLGWILVFWPVVGILVLGLFNRERRSLVLFFVGIWVVELAATEFLYNHDIYGGIWSRFNSTLKWWAWVYAGIILTLGASNLGSSSRLCRYGTMVLLLPLLVFGADLGAEFARLPKDAAGKLAGSMWIDRDPVIRDMIIELASRPDGVTVESGVAMKNTESPAVTLFAGKQSLLGWPWHETTWRGPFIEIRERQTQIASFYAGNLSDPLAWLLHHNVRYVLWLPRDNGYDNSRFRPLLDKIAPRYFWHHMYGDEKNLAVGYWERMDYMPSRKVPPPG